MAPPLPPPKPKGELVWVHSLGMLFVPKDYKHETRLADFRPIFQKKHELCTVTPYDMRDDKHANVSVPLTPGRAFNVNAYMWIGPRTCFTVCIDQLKSMRGNMFLGAQGASLVLEHMHSQMITRRPYVSLDEYQRLAHCEGSFRGYGAAAIMRGDDRENCWNFFFNEVNAMMSGLEFVLCFKNPRA